MSPTCVRVPGRAEPGFMDQTPAIDYDGGTGFAPVLELTPLDASGEPVPGVRVLAAPRVSVANENDVAIDVRVVGGVKAYLSR